MSYASNEPFARGCFVRFKKGVKGNLKMKVESGKMKACASERKPSLLELLQRVQPSFKPTKWG